MKRSPGRPALDDDERREVSVHVRLRPKEYDRLYERAKDERVSVPEIIRRDTARDKSRDRK